MPTVTLLAAAVAAAVVGSSWPGSAPLMGQESESAETTPAQVLIEGDRYDHGDWTLVVQGSFVVPSGTRFGYSEVRADVVLQNRSETELIYRSTALSGDPGYPTLLLRDSVGTTYPLNLVKVSTSTMVGSTLTAQPVAVTGRWTVGYQVPTAFVSDISLLARWEGSEVASWSLTAEGTDFYPGWPVPAEATTVGWGQDIPWSQGLAVTPLGHDLEVCGGTANQPPISVYGLVVQVRNESTTDARWPGVHYPQDAGIAIWADGGSARNGGMRSGETYVAESGDPDADPLLSLGPEARIIPPQVTALRMLGFSLPRDSRFSSPFSLAETVALYPPLGASVWLETSGNELIDFTVPEDVCTEVAAASSFDVVPPA